MKKYMVCFFCAIAALALGAAEMRPLPWSRNLCRPERFGAHSSGRMTIGSDGAETVRFEVKFTPGTDYWAYPVFRFQEGETFTDVEMIRFEIKAETAEGFRFAHLMFDGKAPFVNLAFPTSEYQVVTVNLKDEKADPATVRDIRIGMNPNAPDLTFHIRNLEFLTTKKIDSILDVSDAVTVEAPGTVFTQGEALKFHLKPFAAVKTKWVLYDWKNEVIQQGEWPGSGKAELRLKTLPNGYYKLELNSSEANFSGFRSFTIVPDPSGRPANPELFFAMDSAQSWLARSYCWNPRRPENAYEVVSEVARRAGLQMVRERLSWSETETQSGEFDWKQYQENAALLAERGIAVSGMYHDAPAWARGGNGQLPTDLGAAFRYAKRAAEEFQGQMTVWEFWNEQDIGGTSDAAWDYAAALKAAYLGFKAANPDIRVAIGGYAITPVLNYADVVMKSGAGEYFDIFNIHTYRVLRDFPQTLQDIRKHLERNGISDRPIWFTENGSNAEGVGRLDSYMPGVKMHSPDQEMIVAEYLPKMMINMQQLGVSRDFFFVLPPYSEGGGKKDWGLMRRDFTVKPGYAAFATLTDKLGDAVLEGQLALGEGLRGFLYRRKDGSRTLVYWSESELDTASLRPDLVTADRKERFFSLPVKGEYHGVDLFGTPFVTDGRRVMATRYPSVLERVSGLRVATPAERTVAQVKNEEGKWDKTIVFRTELSDDFTLSVGKDCADVKRDGAAFRLQVWNLSAQAKTGRIVVTGGKVHGIPEQITVPAFDRLELALNIVPSFDREFRGEIRVDGMFDDRNATPLVIPLQNLDGMIGSGRLVEMPQMVDPGNWRANASGKMEISYSAEDQSIGFYTKFPPEVDRWVYPEYLLQLPQESLKGAFAIEFELKASKPSAIKQMLIMAVQGTEQETGGAVYLKVPLPSDQWERRFLQFPGELALEQVKQLRLGLNALEDEVTYRVRNIKIHYAR